MNPLAVAGFQCRRVGNLSLLGAGPFGGGGARGCWWPVKLENLGPGGMVGAVFVAPC